MSTSGSGPTATGRTAEENEAMSKKDYSKFMPKIVELESAMGAERVKKVWAELYKVVGATSEDSRMSVRAAVYVYGALNGTSSVGNYKAKIRTSEGKEFEAAAIIRATGSDVRKFYRSNMTEAYHFFKGSEVMQMYPDFVKKAETLGVGPAEAFVIADFFVNCALFTPVEQRAHALATDYSLVRASTARDGKSLEELRAKDVNVSLDAQASHGIRSQGPIKGWN